MSRLSELNALEESDAEMAAGMSLLAIEDDDAPKVRLYGALAWVHKRRTEPELTYKQFMTTHRTRDIFQYLFGTDDEPADVDVVTNAETSVEVARFPEDAAGAPGGVAEAEGAVRAGDRDLAV
ncbi:MAG TPA: hypothetical protein VFG15_00340 [Amycolatopsis sp.]|nr:hypothetical protein [Amycolatopsis sp.]